MPSEGHPASPGNPFVPTATPVIPDHELLGLIGRGAYGEVWLACNAIGTLRAVKIVHRQSFGRAEHFEREFKGLLKFEPVSRTHEGLVHILQIGRRDEAGYFFYVMELADTANAGQASSLSAGTGNFSDETGRMPVPLYSPHTLRSDLDKGSLPPAKCIAIGLKLASALEHLHANGLVHRDIKPSNIIFVKGEPKVADIGLVTAIDEAQSLVGTGGYIPPEGPGTAQADLYSLGKVLYEIAFGKDRQEFPQLPPDLQSHPDYAALLELNEVILKACETNPRLRYQSAEAISDDLELLSIGKSVKQKRTRQQSWAVAKKVLVTGAVVGVLAANTTIIWRQSRVTRPLSDNPEAVKHYQQAVYQLHSGTPDRHLEAYTNLVEAVRLDPGFVDAHYMMIEANFAGDNLPPYYNQLTNSRVVVAKLRELDPNSAQYHTANSWVKCLEWKFDEAIQEAALAIKINPRFVRAHGMYGSEVLHAHGDAETARREYQIAERLDPSDVTIQVVEAEPFFVERRFDLAIQQLNEALKLEPRLNLHYQLAQAYEAAGQYEKALDEHETNTLMLGYDPEKTRDWYKKMRSELKAKGPRGWWQAQADGDRNNPYFDPWWTARYCARLGRTNEVFSLLNWAYTNHEDDLTSLLTDDCWDSVRGDARFQELVKKMGFHPKTAP